MRVEAFVRMLRWRCSRETEVLDVMVKLSVWMDALIFSTGNRSFHIRASKSIGGDYTKPSTEHVSTSKKLQPRGFSAVQCVALQAQVCVMEHTCATLMNLEKHKTRSKRHVKQSTHGGTWPGDVFGCLWFSSVQLC